MIELYIFIGAFAAITAIIARRGFIYTKKKTAQFKEDVASKVDKMRQDREMIQKERFKDLHLKEQEGKKYDFSQYKLMIRKADVAIAKKQWSYAKKFLIQSMAHTKDELPISMKLASVYLESGDLIKAESLLKKLLELNPENITILENLSRIYVKNKQYKEAIDTYVRAVELNSKNDKNLIALGKLYQLLMRPQLAAECFKAASELKPREVDYIFLLAETYKTAGNHEGALFCYEKILTFEPYNERAQEGAQDMRIKMKENAV